MVKKERNQKAQKNDYAATDEEIASADPVHESEIVVGRVLCLEQSSHECLVKER